ncbi:uncharacterized protein LOC134208897 [Armigeres subalbatus]|uniref:uncharacterized protein LOC134208897 n=1 Tax=Armigeres subalbatus TaxID=124917 RepID=UPI002ED28B37
MCLKMANQQEQLFLDSGIPLRFFNLLGGKCCLFLVIYYYVIAIELQQLLYPQVSPTSNAEVLIEATSSKLSNEAPRTTVKVDSPVNSDSARDVSSNVLGDLENITAITQVLFLRVVHSSIIYLFIFDILWLHEDIMYSQNIIITKTQAFLTKSQASYKNSFQQSIDGNIPLLVNSSNDLICEEPISNTGQQSNNKNISLLNSQHTSLLSKAPGEFEYLEHIINSEQCTINQEASLLNNTPDEFRSLEDITNTGQHTSDSNISLLSNAPGELACQEDIENIKKFTYLQDITNTQQNSIRRFKHQSNSLLSNVPGELLCLQDNIIKEKATCDQNTSTLSNAPCEIKSKHRITTTAQRLIDQNTPGCSGLNLRRRSVAEKLKHVNSVTCVSTGQIQVDDTQAAEKSVQQFVIDQISVADKVLDGRIVCRKDTGETSERIIVADRTVNEYTVVHPAACQILVERQTECLIDQNTPGCSGLNLRRKSVEEKLKHVNSVGRVSTGKIQVDDKQAAGKSVQQFITDQISVANKVIDGRIVCRTDTGQTADRTVNEYTVVHPAACQILVERQTEHLIDQNTPGCSGLNLRRKSVAEKLLNSVGRVSTGQIQVDDTQAAEKSVQQFVIDQISVADKVIGGRKACRTDTGQTSEQIIVADRTVDEYTVVHPAACQILVERQTEVKSIDHINTGKTCLQTSVVDGQRNGNSVGSLIADQRDVAEKPTIDNVLERKLFSPTILHNLLNSSELGKDIIRRSEIGELSTGRQYELAGIIAEWHLTNRTRLLQEDLEEYAVAVTSVFQSEKKETYYLERGGSKRNPGGIVYNKICNLRAKSRKRDKSENEYAKRIRTGTDVTKSNTVSALSMNWLQLNDGPWATILDKWKESFPSRINIVGKVTAQEKLRQTHIWKHVQSEYGYQLMDIDFALKYPNAKDGMQVWGDLLEHIVDYLVRYVHDEFSLKILHELTNSNLSEDCRLCAILILLNCVLPPTRVAAGFKPTVSSAQQEIILFGSTEYEAKQNLQDLYDRHKDLGLQAAPKLIAIGANYKDLQGPFIVCYSDLCYKLPSLKRAVDVFIKLALILGLQHSRFSKLVWLFVVKCIYGVYVPEKYANIEKLIIHLNNVQHV